jgi:mannose-6-phosphate isomerase-like protein (cupin superfamily)
MSAKPHPAWRLVDFSALPGTPCPCGTARRAFVEEADAPASVHVTDIADDARVHYHRAHTETYYILECDPDAAMLLDGQSVPIRPGCCILIPPGVRHRAVGRMRILNIVVPPFDPADEWFD